MSAFTTDYCEELIFENTTSNIKFVFPLFLLLLTKFGNVKVHPCVWRGRVAYVPFDSIKITANS